MMQSFRLVAILIPILSLVHAERAALAASIPKSPTAESASPSERAAALQRWLSNHGFGGASDDPTCPNLVVDPGEDCDDANSENGDGCDSTCHFEPAICGNGILNPGEECDDGNLVANDGCDAACKLEPAVCGNGLLNFEEECDDGNLVSGDGCDPSCNLEGITGILLYIETSTGTDTLYQGVPGSLIFRVVAPQTTRVNGFVFPMKYSFSTQNLIGPIGIGVGTAFITYSPKAHATVSILGWNTDHAMAATNPAFTLLGLAAWSAPYHPWTGSGELWRITFVPLDTGTITIDSTHLPPYNTLDLYDPQSISLPFQWQAKTVTVVAGMPTGNVNGDEVTSSADLVYLVNFLYREGTPPQHCTATGDVDCSGNLDVLDIMKSINYVFKRGQKPCNVAGLVGAGVWECP